MSAVMVRGYIPNAEFGKEIPYVSYIYHVDMTNNDELRFIIWNPIGHFWDIVACEQVRPVGVPTQDVPTNQRIKEYNDWLKEKRNV